jgi:hypothetical protein
MERIKKFNNFEPLSDDNLNSINESKVWYLPSFRDKVSDVAVTSAGGQFDKDILDLCNKILNSEGKDLDSDTTFIGISDDDMLSFSRQSEIEKMYPNLFDVLQSDIDSGYKREVGLVKINLLPSQIQRIENSQGGKLKIGKLIKKIVPDATDQSIEKLVNLLKSYKSGFEIKVVEGDEISKYYRKESCQPGGSLGNSCMAGKSTEFKYIFDIYTKNPQAVKLVVLMDNSGMCVSRALLWKVSELLPFYNTERFYSNMKNFKEEGWFNVEGEFQFLDRVYFVRDWHEQMIFNWVKEKGIAHKWGTQMRWNGQVTSVPKCKIKLNKLAYRNFPYLDTFTWYDVKSATISNYNSGGDFDITSTSGKYYGGTKSGKLLNYVRRFKDFI